VGHDESKAQVFAFGQEPIAYCKGSGKTVFCCVHGLRLRRDSTQVNGRIRKGERKLKGGMAKVSKFQKTENLANGLGVGHAMSEGGKRKVGRPQKTLSTDQIKRAIEAARLGIPAERIAIGCGFHDGGSTWSQYLVRNPDFADQIREAQFQGELELASVVRSASNGWQGSAWLLERTRGYVARASLEHTGKGGKELSISGSLLGAFGGQAK